MLLLHTSLLLLITPTISSSYPLINWFSLDDLFGMKDWTYQSRDLSKEPLVRGLQYRRTYPYSVDPAETKPAATSTSTTTTTEPTTTSTSTTQAPTTTTNTVAPTTTITTTTTLASAPELATTTSTTMTPITIASSAVITAIISDALGANSDGLQPLATLPLAEAPKTETKRENGDPTTACPDNNDSKRIFNRGVDFPLLNGIDGDPSTQSFTCPPNTLFSSYSLCAPGVCCSNIPVGITGTLIVLTIIVIILSILVIRPFFCYKKKSDELLPVVYNDWKGTKFSRDVCEVEPLSLKGDSLAFPFSFSSSVHRKVLPFEEEPPAYAAHPKYIQQQPKILVFHI
ncbi:hypothetical protein PRIPAC_84554 [Pristionchus pacificus]|uniref:Uncharacterized protein n=1 Tax=Pristionchus pacificus TaxID=54126 RepID=A0A2A6BM59_PRIPA|nr:hypothetical protein PRIPAC_84554 [Pristionchus pacificus]|eukprot:PDM67032.1 hypothetical protein PRIPAC_48449 [Pristionchus pacificus]